MTPLLELQGAHAAYGRIEVVHGVDLSVSAGEFVAVLGPNGAGKSTTLHLAAGLHPLAAGRLLLADRSVGGASARQLSRCGVRMLPERRGICPGLTVRENLWLASHTGVSRSELEERAFARFPRLADRHRQLAGTMSGGEQQMLALARVICTNPRVLLLDELSMGLAPMIVTELYDSVVELTGEGTAVIAVEQFASAVLDLADRAVVLSAGNMIAAGTPGEISEQLTETYLGGDTT